jgi:hypothetical protein
MISGDLEIDGYLYVDGMRIGSGGESLQRLSTGEVVRVSSSRRYKKDIQSLNVDYNKFMALRPVSFKWNEKTATPNVEDYGLVAEEVNKIAPELAVTDDKGVLSGVSYQKVNTMLLKVVQDQKKDIASLQNEIRAMRESGTLEALQEENKQMKARLAELESKLGRLLQQVEERPDAKPISLVNP